MQVEFTDLVGTIHGGKGIGVDALPKSELVRDLKEGSHAEDLGKIRAHAREHGVVEEDISLHLLGESFYGSGVAETELCSAL